MILMRFNKQKLIIFAALIKFEMDDFVKQTLQIILQAGEVFRVRNRHVLFRTSRNE